MREFSVPRLYDVPPEASLADIVMDNAAKHPDKAVLARKVSGQWQDVTTTAFLAEVRTVAKGLIASGVRPGDRVALMSRTRYEWTLLDFAIWLAGAVSVPVYETSSAEQIEWIISDSGAVACIVETDAHRSVLEEVRPRLPLLAHLWQIEAGGVDELIAAGHEVTDAQVDEAASAAGPDSLATINYTSGTTGRPTHCARRWPRPPATPTSCAH